MLIINKNKDIFNFNRFIKIYQDGNALFGMINTKESILIDCFENSEIAKSYSEVAATTVETEEELFNATLQQSNLWRQW